MSEPAVALRGVGKRYVKYEDTPAFLTGLLRLGRRTKRGRVWAVRNLDAEVEPGGSLGFIGRNGSGKSTTLAMLAGVTAPSEGELSVRGRIAPLLRLGVGFHDELTGRENIYMNGVVLGMSIGEIERKFDEVVSFADIGQFLDTPVKFYSSGMLVRLGFASAVAAEPDVLIVDEVLSVGDLGFQSRSFARMEEIRRGGATLIVVSHNLTAVQRLCDEVVVLDGGETKFQGPTKEGLSYYHELMSTGLDADADAAGEDVPVRIDSFELLGADDLPTAYVEEGEELTFRIHARFLRDVQEPAFGIWIWDDIGQFVYGENSLESGFAGPVSGGTSFRCDVSVPMRLGTGTYYGGAGVGYGPDNSQRLLSPERPFYVKGRYSVGGIADLHARFEISPRSDLEG